jgi:hypothetical protein
LPIIVEDGGIECEFSGEKFSKGERTMKVEYFGRLSRSEGDDRRFESKASLGTFIIPTVSVRAGGETHSLDAAVKKVTESAGFHERTFWEIAEGCHLAVIKVMREKFKDPLDQLAE